MQAMNVSRNANVVSDLCCSALSILPPLICSHRLCTLLKDAAALVNGGGWRWGTGARGQKRHGHLSRTPGSMSMTLLHSLCAQPTASWIEYVRSQSVHNSAPCNWQALMTCHCRNTVGQIKRTLDLRAPKTRARRWMVSNSEVCRMADPSKRLRHPLTDYLVHYLVHEALYAIICSSGSGT